MGNVSRAALLMASTVWPECLAQCCACGPQPVLAEGQRLPGGPGYPQRTPGGGRPPAPACRGAQRGAGLLCLGAGHCRAATPAVLSSGPGTAQRRSAGAVDLQWAEPVAPQGTGASLRARRGFKLSAGLLGQCHFLLLFPFSSLPLCSSCLPFSLSF